MPPNQRYGEPSRMNRASRAQPRLPEEAAEMWQPLRSKSAKAHRPSAITTPPSPSSPLPQHTAPQPVP